MSIPESVKCPHCSGLVTYRSDLVGQGVKCPYCQKLFQMLAQATIPVRWFVARNRQKHGPFTLPQLQAMAASGNSSPRTCSWRKVSKNGVRSEKSRG